MTFVLEDVIEELERSRSLERIKMLKKKNLAEVAVHFGITSAVCATKSHILDLIENYCIDNDIIDEVEEKPTLETAEVLKLKLEFEHEKWRLVHEEVHPEAQRAHETEKAQLAAQHEEAQKARDLRLAELRELEKEKTVN